ncbi:helix-turn-helix domain-containing protein [Paenibacillus sacheonensis]|uniref:Helix-turn-helix domain-containing protein n=1 Tax=Paenibacillus sacheonensis TaxID=742054 RepID=A0A7X5BWQ4_9BACL|nr:AraC family transcriptional regulator [Paenibacillus sacheonensis]MBM7564139.1 AraC-like DNA-binding protein/quercetin dioxygenase-like cupin family protein [Paenibacillus sacheonensis]NBC67531.1 helix-turn-helix domain-containing protein [Paenibacillus sacheonensis]
MTIFKGDMFFNQNDFPFFIERYIIQKNEYIPSHTHDFIELVFVVEGSALHEMSGNAYQLAAGDVFVVEPNVYHSYTCAPDKDAIVYNVLFDAAFLQREMEVLQQMPSFINFFYLVPFLRKSHSFVPYHPLQPTQKVQIQSHLQTIYEEFKQRREGYQLVIKTRWIECLVWLSRFHQENRDSGLRPSVSDRAWMDSIIHYVDQHYYQPLTLQQLSRLSGMSVSSFTAKFKEAAGMSLLDYKHTVQIRHASTLLLTSDKKVLDIAHETGFGDISFFNRIFRKHTGFSPREFRAGGPRS